MTKKRRLQLISCIMFVMAVVFVLCALSSPNLGRSFYIGPVCISAEIWRVCYATYALIMVGLFFSSFFAEKRQ